MKKIMNRPFLITLFIVIGCSIFWFVELSHRKHYDDFKYNSLFLSNTIDEYSNPKQYISEDSISDSEDNTSNSYVMIFSENSNVYNEGHHIIGKLKRFDTVEVFDDLFSVFDSNMVAIRFPKEKAFISIRDIGFINKYSLFNKNDITDTFFVFQYEKYQPLRLIEKYDNDGKLYCLYKNIIFDSIDLKGYFSPISHYFSKENKHFLVAGFAYPACGYPNYEYYYIFNPKMKKYQKIFEYTNMYSAGQYALSTSLYFPSDTIHYDRTYIKQKLDSIVTKNYIYSFYQESISNDKDPIKPSIKWALKKYRFDDSLYTYVEVK